MKLIKLPIFAACLSDGGVAQVHIQPHKQLVWPTEFTGFIMLEYGMNMPIPMPDLKWTEKGIHATLSVNQEPHLTFVPWEAVVAISPKGQGVIVTWEWCLPRSAQDIATHRPTRRNIQASPRLSIVK